jgi:hypothetical protein
MAHGGNAAMPKATFFHLGRMLARGDRIRVRSLLVFRELTWKLLKL